MREIILQLKYGNKSIWIHINFQSCEVDNLQEIRTNSKIKVIFKLILFWLSEFKFIYSN